MGKVLGTALERNLTTAKPAMAWMSVSGCAPCATWCSYAEQVGSECPSRLETKVHVGRVHEGSAAETNKKRTDGEDSPALFWEIVEWLERIDGEVVMVFDIQRLHTLDIEILLVQGRVCV
jgi:hypothetical protein